MAYIVGNQGDRRLQTGTRTLSDGQAPSGAGLCSGGRSCSGCSLTNSRMTGRISLPWIADPCAGTSGSGGVRINESVGATVVVVALVDASRPPPASPTPNVVLADFSCTFRHDCNTVIVATIIPNHVRAINAKTARRNECDVMIQ